MEDRERLKTKAAHSRLVGGRFNKQRNLHTRLVLSGCKRRCPLLSTRVLKIYLEALMEFNHIHSPESFNKHITLSSLHPWKCFSLWEQWGECTFQGQGRGQGASDCLVQPGTSQLVVTFSPRLPPTVTYCQIKWDNIRKVLSSGSSTEWVCDEWKV